MNKDNAKNYLPLVQALAEGKTIQYRPRGEDIGSVAFPYLKWTDVSADLIFNHPPDRYRVKPEPIELELWYRTDVTCAYVARSTDAETYWTEQGFRKIKVKEVL